MGWLRELHHGHSGGEDESAAAVPDPQHLLD